VIESPADLLKASSSKTHPSFIETAFEPKPHTIAFQETAIIRSRFPILEWRMISEDDRGSKPRLQPQAEDYKDSPHHLSLGFMENAARRDGTYRVCGKYETVPVSSERFVDLLPERVNLILKQLLETASLKFPAEDRARACNLTCDTVSQLRPSDMSTGPLSLARHLGWIRHNGNTRLGICAARAARAASSPWSLFSSERD